MSNIRQPHATWAAVETPDDAKRPAPLTVRVQTLAPRTYFPEHHHAWGQLVYAITGALTVAVEGRSFVISPEQAVWLPPAIPHQVGSLHGAEFRSLWIAADALEALPGESAVFVVSPLLRALIVEAAELQGRGDPDGYAARVTRLIFDQLVGATPVPIGLPWPSSQPLRRLCEALYADPADERSADEWARDLAMSSRTLTRRFESELGLSLRSWRRRVRLFKAIEMLGGGQDVTRTAMDLGYASPSAFAYAFRTSMGVSPQAYMRGGASRA